MRYCVQQQRSSNDGLLNNLTSRCRRSVAVITVRAGPDRLSTCLRPLGGVRYVLSSLPIFQRARADELAGVNVDNTSRLNIPDVTHRPLAAS